MRSRGLALTLAGLLAAGIAAAARPAQAQAPIDWNAMRDETVRMASEYFRINTTIPPGNELAAAKWLKQVLDREGIEAQILDSPELGPNRGNLYARLKGNGTKKAIALVSHMDVVPADQRYWTVDPFSGLVKDGYVWGRGALDMKGNGIVQLMTMIAIKRSGLPLTRDIVFIGNTGEEQGGDGARMMVEKHADLLKDVEYLLTEGGGGVIQDGKPMWGIGVAEKKGMGQRLTAHGPPGHGSRPSPANAAVHLVEALHRINQWETPIRVLPVVDGYFKAIAGNYSGEKKTWLSDVAAAVKDRRAKAWITSDPGWNSLLRTTIALTQLEGSNKSNVMPADATAYLDIRALPDEDPEAFIAQLTKVIADTTIKVPGVRGRGRPPLNVPINTELFRAIKEVAAAQTPGVPVAPSMLTGATDRTWYRTLGIVTYGFAPYLTPEEESRRGVHGNDERISVASLGFGVHFLYDVMKRMQGDVP